MKKSIAFLIAVILAFSMPAIPGFAAETQSPAETNQQIINKDAELEKKYDITITYPMNSDGYAAISENNLITLDNALSNVTPELLRQLSAYYRSFSGQGLTVSYTFSTDHFQHDGGMILAAFEASNSTIYIVLPSKAGSVIASGENPIAIVHELGHAFHLLLMAQYGEQEMRSKWSKYNMGIAYSEADGNKNPDKNVFVSSYAATSFDEDFADTFAHAFLRNKPGQGFKNRMSIDGKWTGLGQKVNFIRELIPQYFKNTDTAIANYDRIYDTPVSVTFEDRKFSGEHLQYIGYPQPKNVLKGILNGLDIRSEKTTWIRELGAWRVIASDQTEYYVFPGGVYAIRDKSQKAA